MKKKIIIITLLIAVFCLGPVYAEEDLEVVIPSFPVVLNDTDYDSLDATYPLINYNGITYFPMTWNLGQSLGLSTSYTADNGLEIKLGQPTGQLEYDKGDKNDLSISYNASLPAYKITVNGKVVDNKTEDYPILNFREITYFPLTWKYAVEEFQWDYSYSNDTGLGIIAEVESEPIVQEAVVEAIESDESSEIVEITNSFRTANQWKIEDDFFYLGLTGDSNHLEIGLSDEDVSFLDSNIDYHLFAYVVELYSGNEISYKLTYYKNYDIDRSFKTGLGDPYLIHPDDLKGVDKVVYRIQFMQSDKCKAFFEDKLLETVDLSKTDKYTSYVESYDETYLESVVVDGEIIEEVEATRSLNVLSDSVKEKFNIVYNFGSGFSSQDSITEVVETLSEQLSTSLISTVKRDNKVMNLLENKMYYIDKLPMSEEYDYMRQFEYKDRTNGGVSLYFLLDDKFNVVGYVDYK